MQFIEDVYGPEGKVIFPFPMLRRLALVASPEPTDAHDEFPVRAACPSDLMPLGGFSKPLWYGP